MRRIFRQGPFALFLAALTLLLSFGPARALLDASQYSETEKVGFAFFKLGNHMPDFNGWAKSEDIYNDLPDDAGRAALLRKESLRLESGFHNYVPEEDLLRLRIPVRISFPTKQARDELLARKVPIPVRIEMDKEAVEYFPYQIGALWVAVVPDGLDAYKTLSLSADDFSGLLAGLKYGANDTAGDAVLHMDLKPVKIDLEKPMKLGKLDRAWLMAAEIGSYELWDKSLKTVAFSFHASWYQAKEHQEILDLYKK